MYAMFRLGSVRMSMGERREHRRTTCAYKEVKGVTF